MTSTEATPSTRARASSGVKKDRASIFLRNESGGGSGDVLEAQWGHFHYLWRHRHVKEIVSCHPREHEKDDLHFLGHKRDGIQLRHLPHCELMIEEAKEIIRIGTTDAEQRGQRCTDSIKSTSHNRNFVRLKDRHLRSSGHKTGTDRQKGLDVTRSEQRERENLQPLGTLTTRNSKIFGLSITELTFNVDRVIDNLATWGERILMQLGGATGDQMQKQPCLIFFNLRYALGSLDIVINVGFEEIRLRALLLFSPT